MYEHSVGDNNCVLEEQQLLARFTGNEDNQITVNVYVSISIWWNTCRAQSILLQKSEEYSKFSGRRS